VSLNYCEKNPVQGVHNNHCYHHVGKPGRARGGVRPVLLRCCWCRQEASDEVFVLHGPCAPRR